MVLAPLKKYVTLFRMSYMSAAMRQLLAERGSFFWTVPNVWTPAECANMRARIEGLGPSLAPITTARGPVVRTDVRTNERVMFDDAELAESLFRRVLPHVPEVLADRPVHGLNARFRGYRYRAGQAFRPHYDGSYRASATLESELTLLVYLNEGFEGGATRFLDVESEVRPTTGSALLFIHRVLHEGEEVRAGEKLVLRSDVMYGT